jgi:hypothetical protein
VGSRVWSLVAICTLSTVIFPSQAANIPDLREIFVCLTCNQAVGSGAEKALIDAGAHTSPLPRARSHRDLRRVEPDGVASRRGPQRQCARSSVSLWQCVPVLIRFGAPVRRLGSARRIRRHDPDRNRRQSRVVLDACARPDSEPSAVASAVGRRQYPQGRSLTPLLRRRQYKNIIGRAGRLAASGQAFLLVEGPADEERKWHRYILGTPEDVRSTLSDPNADTVTLALRVVPAASPYRRQPGRAA